MYTYVIIDDENLTRKGTIKKLLPLADTVTCAGEASNGEEALEVINKVNPDIIITDMNMPIMDGIEFLPLLSKAHPNKQIIVISGYKDFEYTKQAIMAKAVNYILKPFSREEIQASVKHAIQMINDKTSLQKEILSSEEDKEFARYEYDVQLLKNIILGYDTTSSKITSEKLKFINQTHSLVMITLYSRDSMEENDLKIFLQEAGFGDLALYLPHKHNGDLEFLVLFLPNQAAITAGELCRQVIRSLNYRLETQQKSVYFGVSKIHSSLLELHTAFEETVFALNSRQLSDRSSYYFYQENQNNRTDIVWNKTDEFLFRIEAGMRDQVLELLNELFDYFSTIPLCTIADVKYFCFQLTDKVKVIMTYYFDQVKQYSMPSSIQNVQNSLFDIDEIRNYYSQLFINITVMLKIESVYATDDVVEKMKTYIKRNYKNDITLEYLSSLFYLNRSYCSHLFKEKTGEKFVDFINSIRINKAKQLLTNSDKKMYQIAKAVGYDNVKYFFRIFNKFEGVTPEQFRRENKVWK